MRFHTNIDVCFSRLTKEAEANILKLTPQYLELRFIESIANNTKMYFGDKVVHCPTIELKNIVLSHL